MVSPTRSYAAIENISILGVTERLGPLGLWMYATNYLNAARMLPKDRRTGLHIPRAFLVCHSVELALKAYLAVAISMTLADFAKARDGHNLEYWLDQALAARLRSVVKLTESEEGAIREWSEGHRGKLLAYPALGEALKGLFSEESLEQLEVVASTLIDSLNAYCHQTLPPLPTADTAKRD